MELGDAIFLFISPVACCSSWTFYHRVMRQVLQHHAIAAGLRNKLKLIEISDAMVARIYFATFGLL
jgi:hypothetical protein